MKVLLMGATGAMCRQMLPQLMQQGHAVFAGTRHNLNHAALSSAGASPVIFDVLDRNAAVHAICRLRPDVIVHQMTALGEVESFRNLDRALAPTNLLRTQGTDNLLEGARLAGTSRFIAQSYGGWSMERRGGRVKEETDPLTDDVPHSMTRSLSALRHVESVVPTAAFLIGLVLRYGVLYGPGTAFAKGGAMRTLVERRSLPMIGSGGGVWSFLHVGDAASAACAALLHGSAGIYNIADDEPAEVNRWLPAFAKSISAEPPLRIPRWVGTLLAGESVAMQMTDVRGMATTKARTHLHWSPTRPTWSTGWIEKAQSD